LLQDGQWRWEKVQNNTDAWSTLDGNAQVVIENGKFSAKLFAKNSAKDLEISLKGTIRNGKIAAKETILASDYTGSTYHGTIHKDKDGKTLPAASGLSPSH
jgi:hypothetical protein